MSDQLVKAVRTGSLAEVQSLLPGHNVMCNRCSSCWSVLAFRLSTLPVFPEPVCVRVMACQAELAAATGLGSTCECMHQEYAAVVLTRHWPLQEPRHLVNLPPVSTLGHSVLLCGADLLHAQVEQGRANGAACSSTPPAPQPNTPGPACGGLLSHVSAGAVLA